jgi:hypothetical protein
MVDPHERPAALLATRQVLAEVEAERIRQLETWGSQIIKDIEPGDDGASLFGRSYAFMLRWVRAANDRRDPADRNMVHLILEEVLEAAEARSWAEVADYRAELIQVAALAVKAVELVDGRHAPGCTLGPGHSGDCVQG